MNVDFETYSEAGYARNGAGKNSRLEGALKYGIQTVGAAAYAMHPSTEVLSLAYDPQDGKGTRLWVPGLPDPHELLSHIQSGGLLTAWNSAFEWLILRYICHWLYGWPIPRLDQMRCTMSRAKAFSLPAALANSSKIIGDEIKQADGRRLLNLFSVPRNPTKSDASLRNFTASNPTDAQKLYEYNIQDIVTEHEIGHHIPRLSAFELEVWLTDQAVNMRGCAVDTAALQCARNIVADATQYHTARLIELTGGAVGTISETANLREWCGLQGYPMDSVDKDHVATALDTPHIPPQVREALEIRVKLSKSSTAKLHSMRNMTCPDGRIRDMFSYAGAGRTSRWAGRGPQPHNLPRSGPDLRKCVLCHQYYGLHRTTCPYDSSSIAVDAEWNPDAAEQAFALIAIGDRDRLEHVFGDSLEVISGCLRGMFIAGPKKDLISSDYAAIEAVILAELAGEEWRKEVFHTHGRIYEMSAAKITGVAMTSERHVHRGLGKIAELASGYQGWIGAWKAFGADKFFDSDAKMEMAIKAWRDASPQICTLWKNLESSAIQAVQNPGAPVAYRSLSYQVRGEVLYCLLPSGREIPYHRPILRDVVDGYGRNKIELSYMGWNNQGGWLRETTYGGKLTENAVQAIARDIMANALVNLEKSGYAPVLHVHDEVVGEVRKGQGSIEEFELIMNKMPVWASGWPIKATGGWRGHRYRKS